VEEREAVAGNGAVKTGWGGGGKPRTEKKKKDVGSSPSIKKGTSNHVEREGRGVVFDPLKKKTAPLTAFLSGERHVPSEEQENRGKSKNLELDEPTQGTIGGGGGTLT